jgi:hypothetical protein
MVDICLPVVLSENSLSSTCLGHTTPTDRHDGCDACGGNNHDGHDVCSEWQRNRSRQSRFPNLRAGNTKKRSKVLTRKPRSFTPTEVVIVYEPGEPSRYSDWLADSVQTGSGAHPTSYPTGAGGKATGREADHSPPANAEIMNEETIHPLPHKSSQSGD